MSGRIRRGEMGGDQYTAIKNRLFRDPRISFKAKGMFGLISTHRDGWGVTAASLAACSTDGISAVRSGLKEMERYGYLERERKRDELGRLGEAEYFITDAPADQAPEVNPDAGPKTDKAPDVDPGAGSTKEDRQTPRSEPKCGFPTLDNPPQENRTPKKTKLQEDQLQEDQQAEGLAPEGPDAPSASSNVSSARDREEAVPAAGGVTANGPGSSLGSRGVSQTPLAGAAGERPERRLWFERVPPNDVATILSAVPPEFRERLPKKLPLEAYAAMAGALANEESGRGRTVEQLAQRLAWRWHAGPWALWHQQGRIESYVAALVTMLAHGKCPNIRCDDGTDIDLERTCTTCSGSPDGPLSIVEETYTPPAYRAPMPRQAASAPF